MDSSGVGTQTSRPNLHRQQQEADLHRKARDSGYADDSVGRVGDHGRLEGYGRPDDHGRRPEDYGRSGDYRGPADEHAGPADSSARQHQDESGLRRMMNKLNPLRRSPSPDARAQSGGGTGGPIRQPGHSDRNPDVPGQDNRTLGEKAEDALHPRRHAEDPADPNRQGYIDPGRAHNNPSSDPHRPDHRFKPTIGVGPDRQPGHSHQNPDIPGRDNRTLGEKAQDALDPRRHVEDPADPRNQGYKTGVFSHKDSSAPPYRPDHKIKPTVGTAEERQPGHSHQNPDIPGRDNRTLGEKAQDALDPRRHVEDPADPNRQGYMEPNVPRAAGAGATGAGAALGTRAVSGKDQERDHRGAMDRHDRDHPHEASRPTGRDDDRSSQQRLRDTIDPRARYDHREAAVIADDGRERHQAAHPDRASDHHSADRASGRQDTAGLEHSLRETRLNNDNPRQMMDSRAVPYSADSTDTLGRPAGSRAGQVETGLGPERHSPGTGRGSGNHRNDEDISSTAKARSGSSAAGGLHISQDKDTTDQAPAYRPDVEGENYQPGYSIPPAERAHERQSGYAEGAGAGYGTHQNRADNAGNADNADIRPVHATGLRAEGGDFDAARPGAGSEAQRLREQVEKTGSSLDPNMR